MAGQDTPIPETVVEERDYSLTLYSLVPNADVHHCVSTGKQSLKGPSGPNAWKVGLREDLLQAIERAKRVDGHVSKLTHVVLQIKFAPLGVAYYSTLNAGPDYSWATMLHEKVYDDPADWDPADWGTIPSTQ